MSLGRLRLSVADARDLAEGALRGIGYHNDEARIIADHVIDAAMCGYEYSGLAKILNVFESEHFRLPRRSMEVLRETEVSLAFDGGNNVGMLALFHAAQATIKKTASHGIALVSVTDAWMSGRGAYYVEMIAKHGLVAIHTAASSRLVAPPGGIRPVLGTNPIAIAVPSSRGPIVLERIDSEPCCYLCPFSRMMAMRRSVTGSRVAAASSVMGFRLGVEALVSSQTPSSESSFGCSRKDEDRSNDLVRLPCCFRKTLKTLTLSPSPTKSMSPFSLSRSFKASLTALLAF